ncbi:MAG: glycosyltransferase family 2 protein [Sphingomicrobium sp.]
MTYAPRHIATDRRPLRTHGLAPDAGDIAALDRPLISIVVPVKNEQEAIAAFIARVAPLLATVAAGEGWEILFIDDGSSDDTLAAILAAHVAEPRIRALSLSRNFGKEAALSAGLDHALGDAVVPMDVDMQDPPEVLAAMVAKWREGYDMVLGVRRSRSSDPLPKRLTANLFYRAHNLISPTSIPENAGDFRLLDRKVVAAIRALPERNRVMKGLFSWAGFKQASVEYDRAPRTVGSTKFNYWRLWTLALDSITASSTAPLRVWSYVGAIVALFSLGYAGFIIFHTLFLGAAVPGYASLIVSVLFLGGVQLISLGVLGEYVGRILTETKQRPLYVVRDSIGLP